MVKGGNVTLYGYHFRQGIIIINNLKEGE